jgi:hypothetical protein
VAFITNVVKQLHERSAVLLISGSAGVGKVFHLKNMEKREREGGREGEGENMRELH